MSKKERYFEQWPQTGIQRWDDARKKLNDIIDLVNEWTLNGRPEDEAKKLLRRIKMALQTFASNEGDAYADELRGMRRYIKGRPLAHREETNR